ncbi:hypothetical protein BT69DRAFT_1289437 [Atractiella rhizophila]|nr:hypothetical protein BT69DRAFT_1289437 [Atractiella rhizophila]
MDIDDASPSTLFKPLPEVSSSPNTSPTKNRRVLSWLSTTSESSFRCATAARIELSAASARTRVTSLTRSRRSNRSRRGRGPGKQRSFLDLDLDEDEERFKRVSQVDRAELELLKDLEYIEYSPDTQSHSPHLQHSSSPPDSQLSFDRLWNPHSPVEALWNPHSPIEAGVSPNFPLPQEPTLAQHPFSFTSTSAHRPHLKLMTDLRDISSLPQPLTPRPYCPLSEPVTSDGFPYLEQQQTLMLEATAKVVAKRRSQMSHRRGISEPVGWEKKKQTRELGRSAVWRFHVANWTEGEDGECSPPPQYSPKKGHHSRSSSTASSRLSSLDELLAIEKNWMDADDAETATENPVSAIDFISLSTPRSPTPFPTFSTPSSFSPPTYSSVFHLVPKERKRDDSVEVLIREVDGVRFELVE